MLSLYKNHTGQIEFPLNCSNRHFTLTCPSTYYPATYEPQDSSPKVCPEYFRWIHEDLRPWKSTGITREMLDRGKNYSTFKLVIVKGKAYVEKYRGTYQTRDVFTIWGILQLLRLYPGKVPDLELMFWCEDKPAVEKKDFELEGPKPISAPPVFHYCGSEDSLDIVFPDWTFWGWAETNIRPWEKMLESLIESNKKMKWKDRLPYAYWKGNLWSSPNRIPLRKCNVSHKHDWNARLYSLHWDDESQQGFKNSKLEDQCTHRYKIYMEGNAWSVSEKYILACDSMSLIIEPEYYDFFSRSMVPLKHYWPISINNMCSDIKFAVNWGNTHTSKAEAIGKGGSNFIQENLKMKFVYDYMFHLLSEYAKLLRFEPIVPKGALEICSETMACPMDGPIWKKFMVESMVKSPSDTLPCTMPPPNSYPQVRQEFLQKKEIIIGKVETWEDRGSWQ
ncbi:O-glucosyltransferase rumi like [Quillaja saponaria]|uniref:O-glucosyltransferase rumi like n=1 Tax=Quillaja saponaria TaxID=32244 RepID=A0AAD7L4D3_QUISA|nr:O-glucosyltransferase rumi like [Quillaja saponaria]